MKKAIVLFFIAVSFFLGYTKSVFAGCEVSISPVNAPAGSVVDFSLSMHNTGNNPITYVKIPTDLGGYLYVTNTSSAGWDGTPAEGGDVFSNGSIDPGSTHTFTVIGNTAGGAYSFSWALIAAEQGDGSDSFSCNSVTINLSAPDAPTAVPEPTINTPPAVSGIGVNAGSTTATITWNLDKDATTTVNYGKTSEYGYSVSTAGGRSESIVLTGLTTSTTYHYQIQAVGTGGTTEIADNTFTTSATGSSSNSTPTPTTTIINTTSTVSKTVIISDTIPPVVKINTKPLKSLSAAPQIEGQVTDAGIVNAGISKIQYSLDQGKSWLLVNEVNGALKSSFSFIPEVVEDGNYSLIIRAIDKTGNIGVSMPFLVIIDRLPPRIIHSLWHVGPIVIYPNTFGTRELVVGVPTQLVIQGVGGITQMNLFLGNKKFLLKKNESSGFWYGSILLAEGGESQAIIWAKDGGGTEINQLIGTINSNTTTTLKPASANTTIWKFDELTGQYKVWNALPYSQINPQIGGSRWFLPAGTYFIKASSNGYNTAVSNIFSLNKSSAISIDLSLIKWSIQSLFQGDDTFKVLQSFTPSQINQSGIGKQIPWLENKEWEGKDIILSVIPSWDPSAASRYTTLSQLTKQNSSTQNIIIVPGSNISTVDLLKKRGHYLPQFIADPDGDILSSFEGISIPFTVKVNRKGIVEEVLY